jgi:hypothetical protein
MEYKGVECTTELALTPDMIEHLALEAQRRRRATITNTQRPSVLPLNAGGLNDACALPQCDGLARPPLAGSFVGRHRQL